MRTQAKRRKIVPAFCGILHSMLFALPGVIMAQNECASVEGLIDLGLFEDAQKAYAKMLEKDPPPCVYNLRISLVQKN